jgi:hypothetical protein
MTSERTPSFRHLHGHYVVASYAPMEWKDDVEEVLDAGSPRFIVVEMNDSGAARAVGSTSTLEEILSRDVVRAALQLRYRVAYENEGFRVYEFVRRRAEV